MTTEKYHKYLVFMAGEVTKAMTDGATDDQLVRLTAEFNTFKAKCLDSDLPEVIKTDISKIHVNYSSAMVARSTWWLIAGVLTLGTVALILYYKRQSARKYLLRDLKTHLESLAMRTKRRD